MVYYLGGASQLSQVCFTVEMAGRAHSGCGGAAPAARRRQRVREPAASRCLPRKCWQAGGDALSRHAAGRVATPSSKHNSTNLGSFAPSAFLQTCSQELIKTLTTVNCLRVVHAMFANGAIVTGGRRCSGSRSANRGEPFQERTQVG